MIMQTSPPRVYPHMLSEMPIINLLIAVSLFLSLSFRQDTTASTKERKKGLKSSQLSVTVKLKAQNKKVSGSIGMRWCGLQVWDVVFKKKKKKEERSGRGSLMQLIR